VDRPDRLSLWSHCQGVYNLRTDVSLALQIPLENIVVQHVEGAGCYGHNGADDVAFDAALLARAGKGRPVRVEWSRADELAWAPMGAAMAIEIEADLDSAGEIVDWRSDVWSNGHVSRPGRSKTPTVLRPRKWPTPPSASSPSIRRWPTAAAPSATRCRSMICPPGPLPAIAC
jgi:CO/xanthine dehydrogenase Mo-binding subunit